MEDAEVKRPEEPEHPLPPQKPNTPAGPPVTTEDDDPGVPEDPGKAGQHP